MASAVASRDRTPPGRRAAEGLPVALPGAPGFSVAPIVDRFQTMLKAQERSPCTVKQYGHIARMFLGYVGKPLEDVTTSDLERFREHLVLQRHYSKNSLYTTVRGLACLFRSFHLDVTEGLEPPLQAHEFTNATSAGIAAQLLLQRKAYVRNTYRFKLGWRYALLEPMDIVQLTDATLGLDRKAVRITAIEEDDNGELAITAEEIPEVTP